ncbi:class I SAM-dependent methyltransferase [Desulfobotulus sp. H1]|uniref:Class I SAM-dependent methyltransferase n=1 Tax=Desulfobotulus pelophilus TaxID=2823377 RepID=A0ABT3N6H1_9BACT|nr:class I SAM-dependent methyltransferase [Desulfobotulus pelophilus]MCW7753049.1 class I SAM-dependent methyltransferase [Desulfobotulus pelophilus]
MKNVQGRGVVFVYNTDLIERTKGFMDPEEGERLFQLALDAGRMGPCLEIGSYCGKSALYMGPACQSHGGILYSIDHHRGNEEQQPGELYHDPELVDPRTGRMDTLFFLRKVLAEAELEDTVVPLVGGSDHIARFWHTPLSLVFIDGGHTFKAAYTDYVSWFSHVQPGGFLVVHDIFERPEDGGQAPWYVYETAKKSGLFEELPRTKSLGVLRRYRPGELPPDLPE